MSQYRPSSLLPSTLTSFYSIDATVENQFSCQINGNSPTIKYRVKIMKNDTNSTLVYDTNVVTLDSPVYPVSYDGTPNELTFTIPTSSGMVNGTQYKWTVTSYWTDSDSYESYENVFNAYSTAELSINPISSPIANKDYTFSANFSQAEGVTVEKFGWILINTTTNETIVDTITNNNIYSSQLELPYDGLFSGNDYKIMIKCWLTNGVEIETDYTTFSVQYTVSPFNGDVITNQTCDSGVLIEWPNINYIIGDTTNENFSYQLVNYQYLNSYCIEIQDGNSVFFDNVNTNPLSIPSESSHVVSFFPINTNDQVTVYTASGKNSEQQDFYISITYSSDSINLIINNNGQQTETELYSIGQYDFWFVVTVSQNSVTVSSYSSTLSALYPSESLYPSNTLYPKDETYGPTGRVVKQINIPSNCLYNKLTLGGGQYVNYLWVVNGGLTKLEIDNISNISYQPSFTNNTLLLATFDQTLSAGNYSGEGDIVGWKIYRQSQGSGILYHIRDIDPSKSFIVDYGVSNSNTYTYYIFPAFDNGIGNALISSQITTSWWDWYLIVCDNAKNNNDYYVSNIYKFDLDVSSGSMSNNTTFNVLENFTPYPKVQNSNSSYWSGSISSLLGNCGITYSDTIKKMNEIKSLTTDRKIKFLKDRKGNIWKVKLNSPVTEQIGDSFVEQRVTITLSWVEIGDSSICTIIENQNLNYEDIQICQNN